MFDGLLSGIGSLAGAGINAAVQNNINKKNANLQREFAQNSIQWKMEDAKKAGVHPLAALGASTYSAAPSYVGANVGDGVAQAGQQFAQGISKAMEKDAEKLSDLKVRDAELDVLKKEMELRQMGQAVSANNFFGEINSQSAIPVPNGSAPTSGLANSLVEASIPKKAMDNAQTLANQADRVFKIGKNLQISELPPEDGKRRFHLGADPDGVLGQVLSEGNLITGTLAQATQANRVRSSLDFVEKWARKQGLLKPNEEFSRSIFNHSLDGYILEIQPKGKKFKKEYKYSNMMGF